jgi:hypothetical protein
LGLVCSGMDEPLVMLWVKTGIEWPFQLICLSFRVAVVAFLYQLVTIGESWLLVLPIFSVLISAAFLGLLFVFCLISKVTCTSWCIMMIATTIWAISRACLNVRYILSISPVVVTLISVHWTWICISLLRVRAMTSSLLIIWPGHK